MKFGGEFVTRNSNTQNLSEYTVCTKMCSPVIGRKFVTRDSTYIR